MYLCICVRCAVQLHLYAGLFEYFITCWLNFHRILSVLFGYVLFSLATPSQLAHSSTQPKCQSVCVCGCA